MLLLEGWEETDLGASACLRPGPADNAPLQRLIWQETFAEIVALLTSTELMVAYLRSQGLSNGEIGLRLGLDGVAVGQRMWRARRRIERQAPHLAGVLADRGRHCQRKAANPERRSRNERP